MLPKPAALTDRWPRPRISRLPQYFVDTGLTYLSATRTELSSCPVVMVTSTMNGGKWNNNKKKKPDLFTRKKKKVRTPRQPRGRSNTAAHLNVAIKYKLTRSCVNGVFTNVTGVFTMTAARSRRGGSTSTHAASLRSAARMLQVRRLQLSCKPPRRAIPARVHMRHAHKHGRTRQLGGSRSASQTTPSLWLLLCAVTS